MSFFISEALADAAAPAAQAPGAMGQLIMLAAFVGIFYFVLWRPQSKRAKEHRDLVGGLQKGDEVLFAGGLLGRINKVDEDYVTVEVADQLELKVQKSSVLAQLPKGTLKSI